VEHGLAGFVFSIVASVLILAGTVVVVYLYLGQSRLYISETELIDIKVRDFVFLYVKWANRMLGLESEKDEKKRN